MIADSLLLVCVAVLQDPPRRAVDFFRDIQPIFAKRCTGCHGAEQQKAKLRLDRREEALAGGKSGPAFVAGKSAESRLYQFVAGLDPEIIMPPKGARLTRDEIENLRAWIDQGAAWPAPTSHWAFQPVVRPKAPGIDAFISAKLKSRGIKPSPPAERATLIRRLSLDLVGLPPTLEELNEFLADQRPDAYERVVDRLLASPRFGERWGRHWLDLVRYGDSDGYEDDAACPDAWRYRDWVIAAINDDLPYDRFTIEQVAGDLLPDATYDQRVAAGFHRMAPFNRISVGKENQEEFRVKTAKDRASTVATVWMGLTLACAECHSHKYDPIPQRDYYRFYSFFDNLADVDCPAPGLPEKYLAAHREIVRDFDERLAAARSALKAFEENVLPGRMAKWENSVNRRSLSAELSESLAITLSCRTPDQMKRILDYFRSVDEEYARLRAAVPDAEELKNNRPTPPSKKALTVEERSTGRKSFVHVRGDFRTPGEEVRPGTPEFLPGSAPTRLDLARWIVDPQNPLTRRVAVNEIWRHFFGRGLVPTPENFGIRGEPPSHPELLDWLAEEFLSLGWSRKKMIRLIVTSSTYRQSSRARPELDEVDPANALLARQARLRVEAEIVRDLCLAVSELLNTEMGGPAVQPPLPASLLAQRELRNERFMVPSQGADRYRRGVYVNVQRTFQYPMFKDFDGADANVSCTRRDCSVSPQQALTMLNDPVFAECARAFGRRLAVRVRNLSEGFRICMSRAPDEREVEILGRVWQAEEWGAVARTLLNVDEFVTRE